MTDKALIRFRASNLPEGKNPARKYIISLPAESSKVRMSQALNWIARDVSGGRLDAESFPWHRLRYEHTVEIKARLALQKGPKTVNLYLAALRRTLRAAYRMGLIKADDYYLAVEVEDIPADSAETGRRLTRGEVNAIFQACPDTAGGDRDAGAVALLYGTGMRRAELVGLDLEDYQAQNARLEIRKAKGRRVRPVPVVPSVAAHIFTWLDHRGNGGGPLFLPVRRGGHVQESRLKASAVRDICLRLAVRAGVDPFGPHDFRRTFATEALENGADLAIVQRILGHASPTTTTRYDMRGEIAARKVAELIHVPQRKRKKDGKRD